jgi:hypothetical protein
MLILLKKLIFIIFLLVLLFILFTFSNIKFNYIFLTLISIIIIFYLIFIIINNNIEKFLVKKFKLVPKCKEVRADKNVENNNTENKSNTTDDNKCDQSKINIGIPVVNTALICI